VIFDLVATDDLENQVNIAALQSSVVAKVLGKGLQSSIGRRISPSF